MEQGQNDFERLESRSAIRLAAIALGASRSVLVRQHHCQNTRRDVGIGWIQRHQFHFSVIKIDLPEAADSAIFDETEVVLAVRVVGAAIRPPPAQARGTVRRERVRSVHNFQIGRGSTASGTALARAHGDPGEGQRDAVVPILSVNIITFNLNGQV